MYLPTQLLVGCWFCGSTHIVVQNSDELLPDIDGVTYNTDPRKWTEKVTEEYGGTFRTDAIGRVSFFDATHI